MMPKRAIAICAHPDASIELPALGVAVYKVKKSI